MHEWNFEFCVFPIAEATMRLDFLITVMTIMNKGSFALAAQAMNITPSAVSMQVKAVERYFEKALFNRSGPHVTPTPFARKLCHHVGPLLEGLEELRGGQQSQVAGHIRLGTIGIMQPIVLPGLFAALREQAPELQVSCVPGRSQQLIEAVKLGNLDAAVVADPETASRRQLDWLLLREEPFYLITPKGFPSDEGPQKAIDLPWIAYDRSTSLGKHSRQIALSMFQNKMPQLELQSLQAVMSMVASSYAAAIVILPDPRLASVYEVQASPLEPEVGTLRFSLVTRSVEKQNKLLRTLSHCLSSSSIPV